MKRPCAFILLFAMTALVFSTGISSAQSSRRAKKPKAVKPAYITSPPVGKVVY